MKPLRTSPAQIRAQAARAFRQHCRDNHQRRRQDIPVDDLVLQRLARLAPAPLRAPHMGETALSADEVRHGARHGLIDAAVLENRA